MADFKSGFGGSASRAASVAADAAASSAEDAAAEAASAESSADVAIAAASASGDVLFYDTKADADTALAGLDANQVVEVFADESLGGLRTRYRKEGGAYVFKLAFTPSGFEFADAQAFRDDTALTYANGLVSVGDNVTIKTEGAVYEIAPSTADDYDEASLGGLLAYITSWARHGGEAPRGRSTTPAIVDTAWLTNWHSNWITDYDGVFTVTGTAGSATLTYVSGDPIAGLSPANSGTAAPVALIADDEEQMFTAIVTSQNGTDEIYLREPLERDFSGTLTSWGDAPNGQHLTQNAYRVWAKAIADATEFECARDRSFGLMHTLDFQAAAQWEPNALYAAAPSNDGGTFPDRVDKHDFDAYTSNAPFLSGNMVTSSASGGWCVKSRTDRAGQRLIGMWLAGHGVTFRANCLGKDAFLEGWVSAWNGERDLNTYYDPDSVEIEVKVTQDGREVYRTTQPHHLKTHRLKLRRAGDVLIEVTLLGDTPCWVYLGDWSLREAGQGGPLIQPTDRVLVGMDSWGAKFSDTVEPGTGVLLRRGQVARELERQTGCHCIDKSKGGMTGAWVLHWLETWIERYKPDVFITDMAINDNTLGSTWTTTDTPDGAELPLHIGEGFVEESKGNTIGSDLLPTLVEDNLQIMADICAQHGVRLVYVRVGAVPAAVQSQSLANIAPRLDYRAVMEDGISVPAADIENAHSVINFRGGKYPGMRVWNRDAAAVYVAGGPAYDDDWFQQDDPTTTITPADDFAPLFLNRNSQNVATGTALTFALRCNEPVTYTITGGADSGLFSLGDVIDTRTRMLELPGQTSGSYVVEITATDMGGNTTVQTITVTASA